MHSVGDLGWMVWHRLVEFGRNDVITVLFG